MFHGDTEVTGVGEPRHRPEALSAAVAVGAPPDPHVSLVRLPGPGSWGSKA